MKQLKIMLMFALPFFIVGCKKAYNDTPLNADLKANFNFKPGSYWIMKDSISGREDSFFIAQYSGGFYWQGLNSSNLNDRVELVNFTIAEWSLDPAALKDSFSYRYNLYQNNVSEIYTHAWALSPFGVTLDLYTVISFPLQVQQYLYLSDSIGMLTSSGLTNIFPSYSSNGQVFSDVAVFNYAHNSRDSSTLYTYNDYTYLNKDAGFIKIVQDHPQDHIKRVWQAERWHIVR